MARSRSYIAIPPGATIKEQLENREMSQKEFATRMDMSEKHISHLINGDVKLTADVANRLEMVLGLPARFWNNLEALYREKLSKVEEENAMDVDIQISSKIPYNDMSKLEWVPQTSNKTERVIELRKYFEIVRLDLLNLNLFTGIACRRQAITEKSDYALMVWAQKAKLESRKRKVSPINIEQLKNSLSEIRSMTTQKPECFSHKLNTILANCGVSIVFLPHFDGSFLQGATFYDNKKIVLGVTLRGKDADRFWFSLFHEIGHIVLGHLNNRDGVTDEDERATDKFSRELLIPETQFNSFISQKAFDRKSIISFSKKIGIDSGIVVGRLQKEGYLDFSQYNDLKTKYVFANNSTVG